MTRCFRVVDLRVSIFIFILSFVLDLSDLQLRCFLIPAAALYYILSDCPHSLRRTFSSYGRSTTYLYTSFLAAVHQAWNANNN